MNKFDYNFRSPDIDIAGEHPFRRLFLDAMVTEESEGLKRVFHTPKKHRANPVLRVDKPWEGTGLGVGGTALQTEDGKIALRYKCWASKAGAGGFAVSEDGINFTKPNLGLHEWEGSKDNNLGSCNGSIVKMKNPKAKKYQWGVFGYGRGTGGQVHFSEDAITTHQDGATIGMFECYDVVNYFYDPYDDRYVSTCKVHSRRLRAVGIATSKDGVNWTKPLEGPAFTADDLDPDATQIYGMPVFPYQGIYIGLPWIYHSRLFKYDKYSPTAMYEAETDSRRNMDVQFAWSWDLITWNRTPERKPFIPNSPDGGWDCEMIVTCRCPLIVGDELYFYYGGYSTIHDTYEALCGGGLATMRLDGFCSMQAGKSEGSLISRREVFSTPKVTINAKSGKDGYVVAELLDRNNNVIKGFSRKDCIPITGDSVRHELEWKMKAFPAEMIEPDKKIRFFMKNANLYSYLPVDIDLERDRGNRLPW